MKKLLLITLLIGFACGQQEQTNDAILSGSPELKEEIEHYENGIVKTQGNMLNGKREGLWISNFQDGKRWSESVYKNGLLNGVTTVFYPSGVMFYKGKFRENKRIGEWVFYAEDGKIDYKKDYPN